jgi:hypothetical protein
MNTLINILTNPMALVYWVIYTTSAMWVLFAVVHNLVVWSADKSAGAKLVVDGIYQVFRVIDILFNLLTGSIWFMEPPKGAPVWFIETFSDRLRRHYRHEARGWRKNLAALFREPINLVDEGHI